MYSNHLWGAQKQWHQGRLEDANIKQNGYQNTEGYILENDEQPTHRRIVKRVLLATVQLLVK